MTPIKFGTDGWRAVIAEDFTFANLDRVTQAAANFWQANPAPGTEKKVIIGYDRRFLSDQFGQRVAAFGPDVLVGGAIVGVELAERALLQSLRVEPVFFMNEAHGIAFLWRQPLQPCARLCFRRYARSRVWTAGILGGYSRNGTTTP